jgi:L-lactate dehydrogenase complex protein LldE
MKITLFIPCFVDTFYPNTGTSVVKILEHLGHEVIYHPELSCCGQPAFNSGYWDEARRVASQVLDVLREAEVVVIASGSCGAMLKVFYPEIWRDSPRYHEACSLAEKTWEFSDFLVTKLGVTELGTYFPHKVTFHDGCHGLRELGIFEQPRKLLEKVRGLELVEMGEAQTCCGFGGMFAAKFPEISTAMGEVKCDSAARTEAEYIISNDGSCLMHIQGLLDRRSRSIPRKRRIKSLHLAEVLASGPSQERPR